LLWYYWVFKLRMIRWVGYVPCIGEVRDAYNILFGKPKRKRPIDRPRRRWENIITLCISIIH